ncbi:RNA polymerase sigma factor [Kineosporia babensis]|uniref:RNA polymerase subunit sigma-70 n=1 Tax=Kineosporia babensis TaxID=499548 RepID=A0A9X1N7Z6_9ACTN|nr:DUF6596 domain-containing protein [Kineosporia babensis]MCD5310042.1 hypothetical protein [Kineosporia babensis]
MSSAEARAAAEHAARASYGRLIAVLAASSEDIALAEDALSGSFEAALRHWPSQGVPENPEGWLLTVARNRQRDVWKAAATRTAAQLDETAAAHDPLDSRESPGADTPPGSYDPLADHDPLAIGERRLELLFVCAHPAIDPAVRTPLMLQAVLGFEAAEIARAFAVAPGTMAQRLVRAKRRIKDARIPFAIPDRRAMPERLFPVLEAVYGCAAISLRQGPDSLAGEAQYLAVTLAGLLENDSEAWGLASLTTFALAWSRTDGFVPLEEQDPDEWSPRLIADGEAYLRKAQPSGPPGRFQLEAAIQAVHADRRRTGETDWAALNTLYTALLVVGPSLGAAVAAAVVAGRLHGPETGLAALPSDGVEAFQPYWAARADQMMRAGLDASACYLRAAELTDDVAVAQFLRGRAVVATSAEESRAPGSA